MAPIYVRRIVLETRIFRFWGINTGRLGFLAEVDAVEIDAVIMDLYKRNFRINNLSQLHLSIDGESFDEYPCALNEIAILKRDSSSMINIHAWVNGEYLNGYQADGLCCCNAYRINGLCAECGWSNHYADEQELSGGAGGSSQSGSETLGA